MNGEEPYHVLLLPRPGGQVRAAGAPRVWRTSQDPPDQTEAAQWKEVWWAQLSPPPPAHPAWTASPPPPPRPRPQQYHAPGGARRPQGHRSQVLAARPPALGSATCATPSAVRSSAHRVPHRDSVVPPLPEFLPWDSPRPREGPGWNSLSLGASMTSRTMDGGTFAQVEAVPEGSTWADGLPSVPRRGTGTPATAMPVHL